MAMRSCLPLFVCGAFLTTAAPTWADAFDRYTNFILTKAPEAAGVQEVKQLTPELISDNDRVLSGTQGALVIVKTNDGRWAKLLVEAAFQKKDGKQLPILLIDRYVTYKEGQERAIQASGHNVHLYEGFQFSLDLGQVVPAAMGGDLRLVADKKSGSHVEPVGGAKMYLVTRPLPGTEPPKTTKLVVGETFEPRYFNGTYKLYDDGRRSGTLKLKVENDGEVTGSYYSDKDGQKYDVSGKLGTPKHTIQFTIKFPRTEQVFQGWLFTGDARAITGFSRLQERENGFYAVRVENE
jgi:hypothetical protein